MSHHKYGPSTLVNYELCSHYEPEPDDGELHPVTLQGTKCHGAVEKDDYSNLDRTETKLVDFCIEKREEFAPASIAEEEYREKKLDICQLKDGSHALFGTVDHVALAGPFAVVMDYKFGWHGVDAADTNIQGQAYVLGAFEAFPEVEEITLYFLLARRGEVTHHTYTRDDVDTIRGRILTIIERAENKYGQPTPYPHICAYCGAKALCEPWLKKALVLHEKYEGHASLLDVDALIESHASVLVNPDPEQLQLGMELADAMESWAKAFKHHTRDIVLNQGVEVPGRKIIERKGSKTLTGTAAEVYNVGGQSVWGFTPEDFIRVCKVDLTALLNEIKARAPRGKKATAVAETEAYLEKAGLLTKGSSTKILQKEKKKTF
jgi:hypothetical protein